MSVVLKATDGPSWIKVMRNDKVELITTLAPGQSYTIAPAKKITVRTGSAGHINLTVNGKDIGKFGPAGQPLTREFTGNAPIR